MLVCPRSCATVSMSPVVASTLLANVRRPEWPEPLQVEIQRQDGWLGGQVSAALATPLGDRFAHADLAAELARGVHHIGHGQARNLCDAHAAVVTQHEHKNVAFGVA